MGPMARGLQLLCGLAFASAQAPCPGNAHPSCADGSRPTGRPPSCADGSRPVCPDGSQPTPPDGGGAPAPGGGGAGAPASTSPHAAAMLGDIGRTTVTGTVPRTGQSLPVGENIYGPFEAGFGTQQDNILVGLGCSTGSLGHVGGGIDTYTAEQMVAHQCSVTLPRVEGNNFVSLLDECGGHTQDYHFHERMTCLYDSSAGGHSTKVGETLGGQAIYGKWERTGEAPLLDACGGHFGRTPESPGADVYHYHIQDRAPFTVGCLGPNDDGSLVTVEQCRAFYTGCDGNLATLTTPEGAKQYDDWCPCYDAEGSNSGVNIAQLPVFSSTATEPTSTASATTTTPEPTTTALASTTTAVAASREAAETSTTVASGIDGGMSTTESRLPVFERTAAASLTFGVPAGTDACASSFQEALKESIAAAASSVASSSFTADDVTGLTVSGCSDGRRRLQGGTTEVVVTFMIQAADGAAAQHLLNQITESESTFTETFTSTLQIRTGVTVAAPSFSLPSDGPDTPGTSTAEAFHVPPLFGLSAVLLMLRQ